jgi:DNA polymerase-3 subunit delta'
MSASVVLPLSDRLPWLETARASLDQAVSQDRLPHAVLLQASAGLGGEWLASWLAARIFCPTVCGQCLSCRRVAAREHPDLQWLTPEGSSEIRIEQVRALIEQFSLTRHGAGRKVAILTPADRLNRHAANALLKTLEEPSGDSLLVLVTAKPARLPATIASRCLRLAVAPPPVSEIVEWLDQKQSSAAPIDWESVLNILGPAPLLALEVDHERIISLRNAAADVLRAAKSGTLDPPVIAERWGKDDFPWHITALEREVQALLKQSTLQAEAPASRYWSELLEELAEARRWEETPINKSLVIQRLLWRLSAARSSLGRV